MPQVAGMPSRGLYGKGHAPAGLSPGFTGRLPLRTYPTMVMGFWVPLQLHLLEKPLQKFVKYFFLFFFWLLKIKKNYTRPNTLACSKTMFAAVPYVLPVVLDVLGLVLVHGVVERVGVHC